MTAPSAVAAAPPAPWAFYAPTSDARISAALDTAEIRPGDRFLDLGCGDGRVLVAAAARGATVRGIDVDPDLAARARQNLARAGHPGTVEVADIFDASLEADIVFAYLTPATLARLRSRFSSLPPATRIVTPAYRIAGWQPTAAANECFLYRLPVAPEPAPPMPGWLIRATLLTVPPDRQCLVPLLLSLPAGPVTLEVDTDTPESARFRLGFAFLESPGIVPVDFIAGGAPVGHCTRATIRSGPHELDVAVVSTADGFGRRDFMQAEGFAFQRMLARQLALARSHGGSQPA